MWDFGGPVLLTPFELRSRGEAAAGLPPGSLTWTGPFDPAADPDWRRLMAGDLTEREYWYRRGDEWARLVGGAGGEAGLRAMMTVLYDAPEAVLVRPEAVELTEQARAAGRRVAVLTNDMRAFHGDEWVAGISFLGRLDLLVDGGVEGILKPDPRIYQVLLDRLGVPARACVFVDDQPANVAAARALGFPTVAFDPVAVASSMAAAHRLLAI